MKYTAKHVVVDLEGGAYIYSHLYLVTFISPLSPLVDFGIHIFLYKLSSAISQ